MWTSPDSPIDLDPLIVNTPRELKKLHEAVWGNALGQLIGYGQTTTGDQHGSLLTPVPSQRAALPLKKTT